MCVQCLLILVKRFFIHWELCRKCTIFIFFSFSQHMLARSTAWCARIRSAEQKNKNQYDFIWTIKCTINATAKDILVLSLVFFSCVKMILFKLACSFIWTLHSTDAQLRIGTIKSTPIAVSLPHPLSFSLILVNWKELNWPIVSVCKNAATTTGALAFFLIVCIGHSFIHSFDQFASLSIDKYHICD